MDGPTRMCSDGHRALISIITGVAVSGVGALVISAIRPSLNGRSFNVIAVLIGWNIFALLYVWLTSRTFSRVGTDEFNARMAARASTRSGLWQRVNPKGDGPTYAIESAIVAFGVVLVLPHLNAVRIDDWLLVPVTLSILLSCWALAVVSYALHYAEKDLAEPGLDFPGERTHAYADYLYFSIAVATTFGATDVSITTPTMRRVCNLHTVLTFVYNSVIVALLAALIIH